MFSTSIFVAALLGVGTRSSSSSTAAAAEADRAEVPSSFAAFHFGDVDGDGLDDAFVVGIDGEALLLWNRGDGTFEDMTLPSGLAGLERVASGLFADFDGDGRLDLYVSGASAANRLYRNLGDWSFEPVASGIEPDMPDWTARSLDFDGDGRLDLLVETELGARLYRNHGGARFEPVGIPFDSLPWSEPGAPVLAGAPELWPGAAGAGESSPAVEAWRAGSAVSAAPGARGRPGRAGGIGGTHVTDCAPRLRDEATDDCLGASSIPTLGMLYPLSSTFSISGSNVGLHTATPTAPLEIKLGDKTLQIRRDGNLVPGINLSGTAGNVGIMRLRNSLEIWPNDAQTSEGSLDVRDSTGFPRTRLRGNGQAHFETHEQTPLRALGDHAAGTWLVLHNTFAGGHEWAAISTGPGNGEGPGKFIVRDSTSGITALTIDPAGNIGIGRQPTANRLEVEGDASKMTAGSWLANSDRRIKTSVRELDGALATLERVRPVAFHYTEEFLAEHPAAEDVEYYNVIAQEFAEVFPDYVQDSGEHGLLQVDTYPALIHTIAAVKELHALVRRKDEDVAALRERLDERDREVLALEERLVRLERALAASASDEQDG